MITSHISNMKKTILIVITVLSFSVSFAQSYSAELKYSQYKRRFTTCFFPGVLYAVTINISKKHFSAMKNNSLVKFIDRHGQVRVIGQIWGDCGFNGNVKYFRKDGRIKKEENLSVPNDDPKRCPKKNGIEIKYDRKGEITKVITWKNDKKNLN